MPNVVIIVKRKKSKKGIDDKATKTQVSESLKSNSSDSPITTTTVLPKAPLSVHIQKETSASVRVTTENTIPRRTTRIIKPNPPYSPKVENDLAMMTRKRRNEITSITINRTGILVRTSGTKKKTK